MRRTGFLSIALALSLAPAQAANWSANVTCTVTAPSEDPKLSFVVTTRTDAEGQRRDQVQVRIESAEPIMAEGERTNEGRLDVPGHGEFASIDTRGSRSGDSYRTTFRIPAESGFVLAAARGTSLIATIPAEAGTQDVTFDLAGSAVASRQLGRCLD